MDPMRIEDSLEIIADGGGYGVDEGAVVSVGGFGGAEGRLAVADAPGGRDTELIGDIPGQVSVGAADSDADEMPVGIGNGGAEVVVGNRVFTEHVAGADMVVVFEVAGGSEFVDKTRFPVEGHFLAGAIFGFDGNAVEYVPVGPVEVEFDVPGLGGSKRVADDCDFREGVFGFDVGFHSGDRHFSFEVKGGAASVGQAKGVGGGGLPEDSEDVTSGDIIAFQPDFVDQRVRVTASQVGGAVVDGGAGGQGEGGGRFPGDDWAEAEVAEAGFGGDRAEGGVVAPVVFQSEGNVRGESES